MKQAKCLESRCGKVCGRQASKSQLRTKTGTHIFSTAATIRLIFLSTRELYVWGYIPVVVAKWCVHPNRCLTHLTSHSLAVVSFSRSMVRKTDSRGDPTLINIASLCYPAGTEVEGTFRVSGSSKRMSELQAIFEAPPKVCLLTLKASHLPTSCSVLVPPIHQRLS